MQGDAKVFGERANPRGENQAPITAPHRSPFHLQSARGQACVRCGREDETVTAVHYTGLREELYGASQGSACSDLVIADLCAQCSMYFDRLAFHKSGELSEQFLNCVVLTMFNRVDRERLVVIDQDRKHAPSKRLAKMRAKKQREEIRRELQKEAMRKLEDY